MKKLIVGSQDEVFHCDKNRFYYVQILEDDKFEIGYDD